MAAGLPWERGHPARMVRYLVHAASQLQALIQRAEPLPTGGAMVVGPVQRALPIQGHDRPLSHLDEAGAAATGAESVGADMSRPGGVQGLPLDDLPQIAADLDHLLLNLFEGLVGVGQWLAQFLLHLAQAAGSDRESELKRLMDDLGGIPTRRHGTQPRAARRSRGRYGDEVRAVALDVTNEQAAGNAIQAAVDAFGRLPHRLGGLFDATVGAS
jgi:hypothetical protein